MREDLNRLQEEIEEKDTLLELLAETLTHLSFGHFINVNQHTYKEISEACDKIIEEIEEDVPEGYEEFLNDLSQHCLLCSDRLGPKCATCTFRKYERVYE